MNISAASAPRRPQRREARPAAVRLVAVGLAAVRRRESRSVIAPHQRLRHARRVVEAFTTANRYQVELKSLTLAMISYMQDQQWCEPGRQPDFDRWWHILGCYARALASPEMAGPRARKVLAKLLDQNQNRPCDL